MASSIRDRRLALGLSQRKLASAVGLLQAHVSAAETGRASAHVEQLLRDALLAEERQREWVAAEEAGVKERRALAAAVPDSPEWQALRRALAVRAMDLLDAGDAAACDALLELLPESEASRLLDEWLDNQISTPKPLEARSHGT